MPVLGRNVVGTMQKKQQRQKLKAAPFPSHWSSILEDHFPLYARLFHLWVYGDGAPRIADLLLSRHIDVNAKDGQGETPLHLAIRYGQKPAVEWLLKHGADAKARNLRGQTPVELLKVRRGVIRHKDIADLLQSAGNR